MDSDLRAQWQQFDAPEAPASDCKDGLARTKEIRPTSPGGPAHQLSPVDPQLNVVGIVVLAITALAARSVARPDSASTA